MKEKRVHAKRRIGWACGQVRARKNKITDGSLTQMQKLALNAHLSVCKKCERLVIYWRNPIGGIAPPDDVA